MNVSFHEESRATIVAFQTVITQTTIAIVCERLSGDSYRSRRVLFDVRNARIGTQTAGSLVYLYTQLRGAGFPDPIGLWVGGEPHVEPMINRTHLTTLYEIVRTEDDAKRFAREHVR